MNYIISDGKKFVARRYMRQYMATDYISILQRVYGGRIVASGALLYDTKEGAEEYIKRNNVFINAFIPEATVIPYNVCCNCVAVGKWA